MEDDSGRETANGTILQSGEKKKPSLGGRGSNVRKWRSKKSITDRVTLKGIDLDACGGGGG